MINSLRYAYDTVIIAESKNQLQQLMDTVVEESEAKGLFLNSAKSFTMVFSKSEVRHTCKITVHGNTQQMCARRTTENSHREISIHIVGESSEE